MNAKIVKNIHVTWGKTKAQKERACIYSRPLQKLLQWKLKFADNICWLNHTNQKLSQKLENQTKIKVRNLP